jgi:hypothetical protein
LNEHLKDKGNQAQWDSLALKPQNSAFSDEIDVKDHPDVKSGKWLESKDPKDKAGKLKINKSSGFAANLKKAMKKRAE